MNHLLSGFDKGNDLDQVVNILNSAVPVQQVRSTSKHLNQRKATGSDQKACLKEPSDYYLLP